MCEERTCSKCGTTKPLHTEFCRDKSQPSGFSYLCRACHREKSRAYYYANREKKNAARGAHYRKHRAPRTCRRCSQEITADYISVCPSCREAEAAALEAARTRRSEGAAERRRNELKKQRERDQRLPVVVERRAIGIVYVSGRKPAKPRTFFGGSCAWCDEPFVSTRPNARFCSDRHQHYAHKNGVHPDLAAQVYERDGWRCQVEGCGELVDRDAHYNDDLAPTVDHILPKSVERIDELWNLRTAHRTCNTRRRAPAVEQLAMAA